MQNIPLKVIRKTACEVLAFAVCDLFPGVSPLGGAVSDIGFSYDFETSHPLTAEMLPLIEERMRALAKEAIPIACMDMLRSNARELFRHHQLPIERLQGDDKTLVALLKIGDFYDVCEMPCGMTTQEAGVFKLLSLDVLKSGEIRITGTALPDKQQLKQFLKKLDQAKGLDFATLASEMRLYEKGLWLPKGVLLRHLLINFFEKERQGFEPIFSLYPVGSVSMDFLVKRELPARYSQIAYVEDKTLQFFHIFCKEGQLHQEMISSLQFFDKMVNIFGFRHDYVLCPTRAKGKDPVKNWGKSVDLLIQALKSCGFDYETDQQKECFSGPRIELRITDTLGRQWTGPSLGVDLLYPGLKLTGMQFESLEKLIELLTESRAGEFPLWLSPEQVRVLPLAESNFTYAREIEQQLKSAGFRVETDTGQGSLGEKVHTAIQERVPYMVIAGEKEEKSRTISVRLAGQKESQSGVRIEDFLEQLRMVEGVAKLALEGKSDGF